MRRRQFITLLGGAATWPLAARAQQPERMRRIGVLMAFDERDARAKGWLSRFTQGGFGVGLDLRAGNPQMEVRWVNTVLIECVCSRRNWLSYDRT